MSMFVFDDTDAFHYEEFPTWEAAELFAKQWNMELLGKRVELPTERRTADLNFGETLQ
jgi:hypothetical protein